MDEDNVKPYRVYKITSANTPLFYVSSCANPKAYLSQILHNYIGQYTNHVLKNKTYKTCYYVINANDISIEVVGTYDRKCDTQCAIDEIIRNSPDCINNMYNIVIIDKVLRPIRTTLKGNKQTKEQYQEYFREYYKINKHRVAEQQKVYYDNNKDKVHRRYKVRRDKQIQIKIENEQVIPEIINL